MKIKQQCNHTVGILEIMGEHFPIKGPVVLVSEQEKRDTIRNLKAGSRKDLLLSLFMFCPNCGEKLIKPHKLSKKKAAAVRKIRRKLVSFRQQLARERRLAKSK